MKKSSSAPNDAGENTVVISVGSEHSVITKIGPAPNDASEKSPKTRLSCRLELTTRFANYLLEQLPKELPQEEAEPSYPNIIITPIYFKAGQNLLETLRSLLQAGGSPRTPSYSAGIAAWPTAPSVNMRERERSQ